MTSKPQVLSVEQVLRLHDRILQHSGGLQGIQNLEALKSALVQPLQGGVGEADFYPSIKEKAAILGYLLCKNHAFIDGNKRTAHAVMTFFLEDNGFAVSESDWPRTAELFEGLADDSKTREDLLNWIEEHTYPLSTSQEQE